MVTHHAASVPAFGVTIPPPATRHARQSESYEVRWGTRDRPIIPRRPRALPELPALAAISSGTVEDTLLALLKRRFRWVGNAQRGQALEQLVGSAAQDGRRFRVV